MKSGATVFWVLAVIVAAAMIWMSSALGKAPLAKNAVPTSAPAEAPTTARQQSAETPTPEPTAVPAMEEPTPVPRQQQPGTEVSEPEPPSLVNASATAVATVSEKKDGIWISSDELASLPMAGPGWDNLMAAASRDTSRPKIRDQGDNTDVYVMAKALVYARTGDAQLRQEIVSAITTAIGTENRGRVLALGRNLVGYIIAADLVRLSDDPDFDHVFRQWLEGQLSETHSGRTLRSTHEDRPNNWGTHAGAARIAIAAYLGNDEEMRQAAQIFRGYLGDRDAYAGFKYGDLGWQADEENPVGINPLGSSKMGHSIDGALPEEMRRGGSFQWPPRHTGYAWEGLQGVVVQAQMLDRAGYPAWEWQDQAILRAFNFLYELGWPAEGDDVWQVWLINRVYGTEFPVSGPTQPGKNVGWTDWTHGS